MIIVLLVIYLASSILITIKTPTELLSTFLEGAGNTLKFIPTLFAIYATWIPITKILEKSGVTKKIGKGLSPINKRLFPKEKDVSYSHLSLNLSAKVLGMGGAATPSGLDAMKTMENRKNKIMLVVINSTSLQLIPTTVIALRASAGGVKDIILPSLISTIVTTVIAIILVKIFVKP
ncbi:MAG: hypothetical protein J6R35_02260 [Clostridia bacterium]|nr:hypothetical protein [Clostridia bacterium]